MSELESVVSAYLREKASILSNQRYSMQALVLRLNELQAEAREKALRIVRRLWGEVDDRNMLSGGELWLRLEKARAALRQARDDADTLDPARLANAVQAIPGRLATLGPVLDDLKEWYNGASNYDRRALQMRGDAILKRWDDMPGRAYVRDLQRELDSDLTPPEVVAAEEHLETVYNDFEENFGQLRRAGDVFGDKSFLGVGLGKDFTGISCRINREGHRRWSIQRVGVIMSEEMSFPAISVDSARSITGETDDEKRARIYGR